MKSCPPPLPRCRSARAAHDSGVSAHRARRPPAPRLAAGRSRARADRAGRGRAPRAGGGARCEDRRAAPVRRPAAAPPAPPLELITHLSLSVLYSALFRGRCVIPRAYTETLTEKLSGSCL